MPEYKLVYFDYEGFGEAIRLALTHAGVPFEDVRHDDMQPGWKDRIKTPFGKLPMLEIDGKVLPESMAILRYIGEQHGLQADDPFDRAMGDAFATMWTDVMATEMVVGCCDLVTWEWDVTKVEKVMSEMVQPRLKYVDEHVSKSKSGYLTGDKVTWADFYVYNQLIVLERIFRAPMEKYPHLVKFVKKMDALPAVQSWHKSHADEQWGGGGFPGPYGDQYTKKVGGKK